MKLHLVKVDKAYLGVFNDPNNGRAMAEVIIDDLCTKNSLDVKVKKDLYKRVEVHELFINQVNQEFSGDLEDVILEA